MSEHVCEWCGGELVPHCLDCQDSEDLTARWTINEADAAVERLTAQVSALTEQRDAAVAACKAAMSIEQLWMMPDDVQAMNESEGPALSMMRNNFLAAIAMTEGTKE